MKLLFFYEVYDLIKFRKMFCKKLLKLFKSKIKYMYKTRRKRSMEKYKFKNFNEKTLQRSFSDYILGVDVGGTNTTFAVAGVKNNEPILDTIKMKRYPQYKINVGSFYEYLYYNN